LHVLHTLKECLYKIGATLFDKGKIGLKKPLLLDRNH
jgi:hypothetical protein